MARAEAHPSAGSADHLIPLGPPCRRRKPPLPEGGLVRFGLKLANWSEQWFPDPLVFALLGVVVVFVIGVLAHESPTNLAIQAGKSFWSLVPFTMQMVMIIVGGYVVASSPLVNRAIQAVAGSTKTPAAPWRWWRFSRC